MIETGYKLISKTFTCCFIKSYLLHCGCSQTPLECGGLTPTKCPGNCWTLAMPLGQFQVLGRWLRAKHLQRSLIWCSLWQSVNIGERCKFCDLSLRKNSKEWDSVGLSHFSLSHPFLLAWNLSMKRRLSVANLSSENNSPTFCPDDDWSIQLKCR